MTERLRDFTMKGLFRDSGESVIFVNELTSTLAALLPRSLRSLGRSSLSRSVWRPFISLVMIPPDSLSLLALFLLAPSSFHVRTNY